MRNLLAYPIEAHEVIGHLKSVRDEEEELQEVTMRFGDTKLICLNLLIKFLEQNPDKLENFLENNH